jgi:hypothetical protein
MQQQQQQQQQLASVKSRCGRPSLMVTLLFPKVVKQHQHLL